MNADGKGSAFRLHSVGLQQQRQQTVSSIGIAQLQGSRVVEKGGLSLSLSLSREPCEQTLRLCLRFGGKRRKKKSPIQRRRWWWYEPAEMFSLLHQRRIFFLIRYDAKHLIVIAHEKKSLQRKCELPRQNCDAYRKWWLNSTCSLLPICANISEDVACYDSLWSFQEISD